MMQSIIADDDI